MALSALLLFLSTGITSASPVWEIKAAILFYVVKNIEFRFYDVRSDKGRVPIQICVPATHPIYGAALGLIDGKIIPQGKIEVHPYSMFPPFVVEHDTLCDFLYVPNSLVILLSDGDQNEEKAWLTTQYPHTVLVLDRERPNALEGAYDHSRALSIVPRGRHLGLVLHKALLLDSGASIGQELLLNVSYW